MAGSSSRLSAWFLCYSPGVWLLLLGLLLATGSALFLASHLAPTERSSLSLADSYWHLLTPWARWGQHVESLEFIKLQCIKSESHCRWSWYRPVSPATRLLSCCWSLGTLTCATLWLLLLPAHLAPPATRYLPSMCILASWHIGIYTILIYNTFD